VIHQLNGDTSFRTNSAGTTKRALTYQKTELRKILSKQNTLQLCKISRTETSKLL